jgi:hypothetical protein
MANKKNFIVISVLAMFFLLALPELSAQCPMCKIAAESNLKNGGSQGKGLNLGILYMLATPYLLIGGIGLFWWKNRKKDKAAKGFHSQEAEA